MREKFLKFLEDVGPKLLSAVIVLVVGILIIKFLMSILKKAFAKSKIDPICHKFILSLLKITLYIVLFIVTLSMLKVDMTSLVALLSVAGLAVSLAVQGSLANLAGGFILLFSKPFKVG
ncbi:MAG: small-conductance mechanosensitive channel, partial [Oscillospiraceae bacterium]